MWMHHCHFNTNLRIQVDLLPDFMTYTLQKTITLLPRVGSLESSPVSERRCLRTTAWLGPPWGYIDTLMLSSANCGRLKKLFRDMESCCKSGHRSSNILILDQAIASLRGSMKPSLNVKRSSAMGIMEFHHLCVCLLGHSMRENACHLLTCILALNCLQAMH